MSEPSSLFGVFGIGVAAAVVGTMVGGGSLLSIPFLIFVGLPPQVAIATDRFGVTIIQVAATQVVPFFVLTIASLAVFATSGIIDYRLGFALMAGTAVGGYLGVHIAIRSGEVWVRRLFAGGGAGLGRPGCCSSRTDRNPKWRDTLGIRGPTGVAEPAAENRGRRSHP